MRQTDPRASSGLGAMRGGWRDLRHAARALAKAPGFTTAAVAILALGIGLNVTMFSVVNAFLLRPLPYPDDDRLVLLDERATGQQGTMKVALADFADWQDRQRVFTGMAAYQRTRVSLSRDGDTESVDALRATTALFRVLGVSPASGRGFAAEDEQASVVVISDLLWRRRYDGRPIVGETIFVNGAPQTVVGIMPAGFSFPERAQLWLPAPVSRASGDRSGHGWWVVARLAEGRTLAQARGEMASIGKQLVAEYPQELAAGSKEVEPVVMPYRDEIVEPEVRGALLRAMAAVGFVLLIACVNIANLVLARGSTRGRELALRAALGADRWRIARLLLSESLLLAALGAAVGLIIGRLGVIAANAELPRAAPAWMRFEIDLTVVAFTVGLLLATSLVFGLIPTLRASRPDLRTELAESNRNTSAGRPGALRQGPWSSRLPSRWCCSCAQHC